MTPEEAGQRVLEGHAWAYCKRCGAGGQAWEPTSLANPRCVYKACSRCSGLGVLVESSYAKAIKVLGLPWPAPPTEAERIYMRMEKEQVQRSRGPLDGEVLAR